VGDHVTVVGQRQPGDLHRPSDFLAGGPSGTSILRSVEAHVHRTARFCAIGDRVVIINDGQMSGGSGGGGIGPNTGDEMIDGARDGVDGNTAGSCPLCAVSGCAEDDVVGTATRAEAAIAPHHINITCAVNGCGRQIGVTQTGGDTVLRDAGDICAAAPGLSAVGGSEGGNPRVTFEGNDDGSVGLDERFSAETSGVVSGRLTWAPGLSAVARCAHHNVARAVRLIPFGVAVSIVRTTGSVIADDPVLVVEVSGVDGYGTSPVQAVGRTADGDVADVFAVGIQ